MNTQIFATFGPACKTKDVLKEMVLAGVTGMRLNLSHTTLFESQSYIENYQEVGKELSILPQILIDMQGPELRVGDLEESLYLEEGQSVYFVDVCEYQLQKDDISKTIIPVPTEVISALQQREMVLLDDGKILLRTEEVLSSTCEIKEKQIRAMVLRGGVLKGHKSVKIENHNISMPVLTAHDIENIKIARQYGVTALMQPFVLSGEDIVYVRRVLEEYHAKDLRIYAKIENRIGLENLESIVKEADVIIIARGDLGNDMPLWELPRVQKQIENCCKSHNKPYVVVTQMLASMEQNPMPTRAEVSDIFHAVYHGAWGVMLTGETAIGKYPVEAVKYMANTVKEVQKP